jgi:hypothetical protein
LDIAVGEPIGRNQGDCVFPQPGQVAAKCDTTFAQQVAKFAPVVLFTNN